MNTFRRHVRIELGPQRLIVKFGLAEEGSLGEPIEKCREDLGGIHLKEKSLK